MTSCTRTKAMIISMIILCAVGMGILIGETGLARIKILLWPSATATTTLRPQTCLMVIGNDDGKVLTNADLEHLFYGCHVDQAGTVVEVNVFADAGTSSIFIHRYSDGEIFPLLRQSLATDDSGSQSCSKTTAKAGMAGKQCWNTLQNIAMKKDDWLGLTGGKTDGIARRITIVVVYSAPQQETSLPISDGAVGP